MWSGNGDGGYKKMGQIPISSADPEQAALCKCRTKLTKNSGTLILATVMRNKITITYFKNELNYYICKEVKHSL